MTQLLSNINQKGKRNFIPSQDFKEGSINEWQENEEGRENEGLVGKVLLQCLVFDHCNRADSIESLYSKE